MTIINTRYLGDLQCEVEHEASGSKFLTDAPLDNNGKARQISPTDLLVGSLSSCVLTIMGIRTKDMGTDLVGTSVRASKEMGSEPRRHVSRVTLTIDFPRDYSDKEKAIFDAVVKTCPVASSLGDMVEVKYDLRYPAN
ncbi:MAG: OsmC family protein [Candidatus Kapaibacteriales bacterium]